MLACLTVLFQNHKQGILHTALRGEKLTKLIHVPCIHKVEITAELKRSVSRERSKFLSQNRIKCNQEARAKYQIKCMILLKCLHTQLARERG